MDLEVEDVGDTNVCKRIALALPLITWLIPGSMGTLNPLAAFDCREFVGAYWPRTLVTYPRGFLRGAGPIG